MDVAVYFSLTSKIYPEENGTPVPETKASRTEKGPHFHSALGAARALKEHHIPFGIISRNSMGRLSAHRVIVLPEVLVLDGEEQRAITEYVKDGGAVYASGRTARFLSDLCGISYEGQFEEAISYIAPEGQGRELLPDSSQHAPLSIYGAHVKANAKNRTEVMATVVLPATDPADPAKLASIHTNPPGRSTERPAIVYRSYGKGKVIWVSAPLEEADKHAHKNGFVALIRALAKQPFTFQAEAPPAVEVVLFHQKERRRYIFSVVNEQELLPPVAASGIKVTLQIAKEIVKQVEGFHRSALKSLEETGMHVVTASEGLSRTKQDMLSHGKILNANDIEVLVVYVGTWTYSNMTVEPARLVGVPVVVWTYSGPGNVGIVGGSIARGALDEVGITTTLSYGDFDDEKTLDKLRIWCTGCAAVSRLRGATLGAGGSR